MMLGRYRFRWGSATGGNGESAVQDCRCPAAVRRFWIFDCRFWIADNRSKIQNRQSKIDRARTPADRTSKFPLFFLRLRGTDELSIGCLKFN